MFGESDSESPRVPSPWDSLTSTPPTPPNDNILRRGLPKLVPESEEGNVEYKLHLLSPSPSRFTHLVTQLKWRLLEGGGQAYYELGVADSGLLIGLARREMEETLATLEEMAGEIGASVIVVKEIEVLAEEDRVVGSGDGHRWTRRQMINQDSETTATTKTELEISADDEISVENSCVEVFSMDESGWSSESTTFTTDLEIATVYKPRPFRRRASTIMHGHLDRRKSKGKRPHLLAHITQHSHPEGHTHHSHHSDLRNYAVPMVPTHSTEPRTHTTSESKKSKRCASQDKRRQTNCDPPHVQVPALRAGVEEIGELVSDLESFHVTLESEHSASMQLEPRLGGENLDLVIDDLDSGAHTLVVNSFPSKPNRSVVETRSTPFSISTGPYPQSETITSELDTMIALPKSHKGDFKKASLEPRLIVEALVVRKMSLDEAFLDFGGFSVL